MTYRQIVQEDALSLGMEVSDEDADFILWERTAFPCCDEDYLRAQIRDELEARMSQLDALLVKP